MATDHDRLFKLLLQTFFQEFIELFFPEASELIDFNHVTFLSQEVYTDITSGKKGRVDLLAETRLKGEDALIIVHVEPQAYADADFAERMFLYSSRLYEKYRRRILPVAVFSYNSVRKEPDSYSWGFPFLDVLTFRFLTVELRKKNWRDYLNENNPVAAALLSSMGYNKSERVQVKKQFLRMLVRLQLDEARSHLLAVFFDTYLQLAPHEEQMLHQEVAMLDPKEEARVMEMLTTWQKMAKEEGRLEGRLEGKLEGRVEERAEVARKLLFLNSDYELITKVTGLSREEIEQIGRSDELLRD